MLERPWNENSTRSSVLKIIFSIGKHPITGEKLTWVDMKK
nr:MAG TPA: TG Pre-toxin TG [Caudoviricetes sp.]